LPKGNFSRKKPIKNSFQSQKMPLQAEIHGHPRADPSVLHFNQPTIGGIHKKNP